DYIVKSELHEIDRVWMGLYKGKLVADDIYNLVQTLPQFQLTPLLGGKELLGNHTFAGESASLTAELERIASETRSALSQGLLSHEQELGYAEIQSEFVVSERGENYTRWEQTAWTVLRECLKPDRHASLREQRTLLTYLPLLNEHDRRAFLRARWNP